MTEKITPIKSRDESVRYIGNWHESIPRILFMDPFMHAQDRNVYCVIRALMSEEGITPNREMRFPDYSEIMKYGNIRSRVTITRAIMAARIIGWIVLNNASEEKERDKRSGRFKPKQWFFLDEPMPLSEICEYDHGFFSFIEQAAERQDEHIADLAHRVLEALIDDHGSEQDTTLYDRRLDAYETVKADSGANSESRFFGIPLMPESRGGETSDSRDEEKPPCTESVPGRKTPCTESVPGRKPPCTESVPGQKPPCTESVPGQKPPCTESVPGELHHIGAISPKKGCVPAKNHHAQNLCMAPCSSSSSSSSSRKTTTTKPEVQKKRTALFERIGFNPNFRAIFTTRFDRLPDEYQVLIILEMHARMDRKLNRNNSAYLGHLLKTTLSALQKDDPGLLIFTPEYSSPDPGESQSPAADPAATLKQELQHAHADYRHWQQMQQSATEAQLKQVNVMVDMAKNKIKLLESQMVDLQESQHGSGSSACRNTP